MLGEICGRTIGCAGGLGGSMHLVEPCVGLLPTAAIIGAGLPIACGAAMAARARGTDRIAVSIFGDGSANIGAFHESLNFAAIRKLPVVFVCENNLYGEYTRIQLSTPVEDIAVRAGSYNMPGVIVDGQDVDKVAEAMATAVARARRGDGPTLIEMKTYRYSGHSRSDPATYRPAGELDAWLKRDPINIFAERLVGENVLAAGGLDQLKADTPRCGGASHRRSAGVAGTGSRRNHVACRSAIRPEGIKDGISGRDRSHLPARRRPAAEGGTDRGGRPARQGAGGCGNRCAGCGGSRAGGRISASGKRPTRRRCTRRFPRCRSIPGSRWWCGRWRRIPPTQAGAEVEVPAFEAEE